MRRKSGFTWLVLGFLFLLSTTSSFAQQADTATVVGSVTDSSNAAVTGATVTLTHVATNSVTQVQTNERGEYRTPPLRIGEYTVGVEATGFKHFTQSGVVLNIGDVREVDAALEVGQVTDSVTVTAEAPLIHTEDATVGTVITNQHIEELPLNGRDYLQLAALSAGTVPNAGAPGVATVGISIGGQSGQNVAFLLDGQDNNSQQINTSHSQQKEVIKPSVDAIQEFKVLTNGNSAEYGRSASGVISVAIKSGTNEIHGTAFEFFRNSALDAENLFTAPGTPKPPFGRNQFGASVGGPILHNKTFFFGDFEIARIRTTDTTTSFLPTVAQTEGLFSTPITNPATGTLFPQNASGQYVIPTTSFDPIATKILPFFPAPQPGVNGKGYNYVYPSPDDYNNYRWDFRVNQILSAKHNLFFRFSEQVTDLDPLVPLPPDAQGQYIAVGTTNSNDEVGAQISTSKSFVLADNYVWSPTLVSSIRAGWNYMYWDNTLPTQSLTNQSLGIPGINTNYDGFSSIAITGYQTIGITNVPNADWTQDRELRGDVTWTKGPHTFKFGVDQNWTQMSFNSSQSSSGTFSFNGQYTGNAFADFLLGDVSSASLSKTLLAQQRTPLTAFFAEDDWRVTRRLTLNLGLRYELNPPAIDTIPGINNVNLPSTPPSTPEPLVLYTAGPPGSGRASQSLLGVDLHQWAPRFGFAYALPDDKTVVRGSYGIFYAYTVPLRPENNPPNQVSISETTDPTGPPSILLQNGFAANALSVANATNVTLTSIDNTDKAPIDQQWSFDIQRQLPHAILVEVGYYGNKFDHAWRSWNGNQLEVPEAGKLANNVPYKTVLVPGVSVPIPLSTSITRDTMDGYSRYNALQAKFEKRYSHGLTFVASYAYSKTMALGDASNVQNLEDVAAERAAALQDMTHHFVGSGIYELPFGRGKEFGAHWNGIVNGFLGGWSVSPIVTVDSGFPLNLTENTNPSNTGGTDRPNVIGNWHLADPTVQEWFNTSAFAKNAALTYGDAGRNIIRGPGLINLDFAAHKSFQITERVSAELRLESFNITNTPALGPPGTELGAPSSFGIISQAGPPRDNQIGVKVLF